MRAIRRNSVRKRKMYHALYLYVAIFVVNKNKKINKKNLRFIQFIVDCLICKFI